MTAYPKMFSPISLGPVNLENRITMAPLFMSYAKDGQVNDLVLSHYAEMASSGAAMIVVENACIHSQGMGSPFTLRVDDDSFIPGLERLANTIKDKGTKAALQINHAGRFAIGQDKVAPSAVPAGNVAPRPLDTDEIPSVVNAFADAAARVKAAGFDLVELHGGTGYLLAQFLSPRTNRRDDDYGGDLQNRLRFSIEVIAAVRQTVGPDYPIGCRYLADEWLEDGFQLEEATAAAPWLEEAGLTYLSVMGGTYESFFLPERLEQEKRQGYMVDLAAAIKGRVDIPVITAGRIQTPDLAESILAEGRADLIGLARVLLADPLWPTKAREGRADEIIPCEAACSLCFKRVASGKEVFCSQWPKQKRDRFGPEDEI